MIPPVALTLVSAAILAYEVLLVRLFAIVQWHHFAFMAISIALLGFGVSGTLIVLLGDRATRRTRTLFTVAAAVFAASAPGAFLVAQRVPFNALEVVWAPSQLLWLALIYLLLTVPFTAGALCVGLAFRAPGAVAGRVYLWNLLGSGAGAVGVVGTLFLLPPAGCLELVGALALAAALAGAPEVRRARWRGVLAALAVIATAGAWAAPAGWTALRLSEFKGLSQTLAIDGTELLAVRSSPMALLSLVASPEIPFRHAPGLSLFALTLPPAQLGVFVDGEFATAIDLWDGELGSLTYLDYLPDALAYHLSAPQRVLVLEAGGGRLALQALAHGARGIDAVESDPDMVSLLAEDLAAAGRLQDQPGVQITVADARHFLDANDRRWDLIQLPLLGAAASAPARGLNENFLFTAEGLARAYSRLSPGGWISATVELDLPPRAGLKLVATLRAGLAAAGVEEPAAQVLAIRSLTMMTILARRGAIREEDVAALRRFAVARGFDLVHYPGMGRAEANQRIRLAEPVYHDGLQAVLGRDPATFVDRYRFDITAATDDRPYIHDVFRWAALPELFALGPAAGAALIELGELIVTATLLQAVVLAAVLVLLPLRLRLSGRLGGPVVRRFGLYFTALGLAFLFIEIAWIQRFVQLLGHPLYAVSVGLSGFLFFAGLGAGASVALDRRLAVRRVSAPGAAIGGIVFVAGGYLVALPGVLEAMAGWPAAARVLSALALIAPLAFFMGMPFPLGLSRLARADPDFVPWAWGLNGCASVVSAAAATLISMNAGISATVLAGIGLYVAALALLPKRQG